MIATNWSWKLKVARILSVLTLAVPAWGGNFVTNGSFDIPGVTTNGYVFNGTQNLPGWTGGASGALDCYVVATTNQFCGYATFATNEGLSPNGGGYVMFDADPAYTSTLSQTVSGLTVGQTYEVSFYQAADHQGKTSGTTYTGDKNLSFTVSLTTIGLTTNTTQSITAPSPNPTTVDAAWQLVELVFTARTTSETLSFAANGPSGGPPVLLLDGVSMTVPEPSEWMLVGLGGVFLFLGTRFQNRPRK